MPTRLLRLLVLVVLALPTACESAAVNQEAHTEQSAVDVKANTLLRKPVCDDGRQLGPGCGLITEELGSLRFRTAFLHKRCVGVDTDECQHRYFETVATALEQRYPEADPAVVSNSCQMPDADCHDLVSYELVVMDSHNAAVSDWASQARLDIERRRERGQMAYGQNLQEAFVTALYLVSKGPKCVSHKGLGDTTLTFCSN